MAETPSFFHYSLPNQSQNVFNIKENPNNPWLDSAQINVKPLHLQTSTSYNNQSRNRTTTKISLSPQLWQLGGKHIKSPSHITQWFGIIWIFSHTTPTFNFHHGNEKKITYHLFQNNQITSFNTLIQKYRKRERSVPPIPTIKFHNQI